MTDRPCAEPQGTGGSGRDTLLALFLVPSYEIFVGLMLNFGPLMNSDLFDGKFQDVYYFDTLLSLVGIALTAEKYGENAKFKYQATLFYSRINLEFYRGRVCLSGVQADCKMHIRQKKGGSIPPFWSAQT